MAVTRQCDKCKAVPAVEVTITPEGRPPWTVDLCDGCLKAVRPGGKAGYTHGFRKVKLPPQPQ